MLNLCESNQSAVFWGKNWFSLYQDGYEYSTGDLIIICVISLSNTFCFEYVLFVLINSWSGKMIFRRKVNGHSQMTCCCCCCCCGYYFTGFELRH